MNIAFFLTPKSEVVYENIDANMRQVIENGTTWVYCCSYDR